MMNYRDMAERATFSGTKGQSSPALLALLVVALAGLFLVPQAYGQADIYVATDGTHATGPDWSNPTSLTNALAIATADEVIWIKEGTYTNAFSVSTDGLQIYGGFDGTESLLSERDWTNAPTLLDGDGAVGVVDVQAHNVLLDGLFITNGYTASRDGAGLRVDGYTNLTMLNCDVVNNIQYRDNGKAAGAYFYNAGDVLISNCVINANTVTRRAPGPGFYSRDTDLTFIDCEIRGNVNTADAKGGGGFYLYGGTLSMLNTTVADNDSNSGDWEGAGGGGYIRGATVSLTNCVFTGNESGQANGGALRIGDSSVVTIDSCTFADNRCNTNSTTIGGAIYQINNSVTIRNSIFWGNKAGTSASAGHAIYQNAGILDISYCCFDGTGLPNVRFVNGTWGDGIITNDPLFATEYTDVHLQSTVGRWNGTTWTTDASDSPCIDAGDPSSSYANEPPAANGGRINMGAYGNTWQASQSTNEAPTVDTLAATVVANAAQLRGELTTGSVSTITFYYGLTDKGTTAAGWDETNVLSEGQSVGTIFNGVAGGLQESQTYWYRAYATNAFGEDWGDAVSFLTDTAAPGGGSGVIHVDADAIGPEDGLSWTNAFTTFEDALAAADEGLGTSIWIAAGSYSDKGNAFVIQTNELAIYGGFTGIETNLSERNWTNNEVLLDGDGCSCVIDIQANDVLLDGLIITNGFEPYSDGSHGAGVRMNGTGTGLTMLNCRLVNNTIALNGGRGGRRLLPQRGQRASFQLCFPS